MLISRLTRKSVDISVSAILKNGVSASITGVDVALMVPQVGPNGATQWVASSYAAGVATLVIAGPDADSTGALVVPADGADLWIKVNNSGETEAVFIERIVVASTADQTNAVSVDGFFGETPNLVVSDINPNLIQAGIWVQTGLGDGSDFTFWIEDGQ